MLNASRAAVLAAFLFALPLAAPAHERDAGQADDRLVDKFARFAGSRSNAESLVNGLRNDQLVKLTSAQQGSASFTPKTDRMGFGNVNIALTLAKATLAEQGITRPTPQQIEAVLNGGTITSRAGKEVKLTGILAQRASGLGWGKIAQANGFKLGELMRHHGDFRHHRHHAEFKHHRHHHAEFAKVRFERHERMERAERPERHERMERAERPERPERGRRG
ncbi:MAG TPA: hypothetical protein VNU96_22475 [Burkholderiales bacterium]|jgi:hypothetical protein|nr:hypothetical protein [Burkholderiales bacterium]